MDRQEGFSTNKDPLFNGSNYTFWRIRMRNYLMALGFDIWGAVKNGYTTRTSPHIDATRKSLSESNSKAMNAILCGLKKMEFVKVMHCDSTIYIWDKL